MTDYRALMDRDVELVEERLARMFRDGSRYADL